MSVHYGFEPDAARARLLDRGMHAELAASLAYLAEQASGHLHIDAAALDRLLISLNGTSCYSPRLFGDYFALVGAMADGDVAMAQSLFDRVLASTPVGPECRVAALRDPAVCARSRAYLELLADPSLDIAMLPPDAELFTRFQAEHAAAMARLRDVLPELAGEIDAIVREVICVAGDRSRSMQFDGGSHFQLWGALFLNADMERSLHQMIEVLAHESAHSLLFGFCTEMPLVHNDDETLYASPLRRDPRPMDGIFHATFVSARMHWAMSQLLEREHCNAAERQRIRVAIAEDQENFHAGDQVIARHAELSPVGAELMAGARAYMAQAGR